MQVFYGPRQSGRTELLIRKAVEAGSALIVTSNHVMVKDIKYRLKQNPVQMDINVITFRQFVLDMARGIKYSNILFDDLELCVDSIVPADVKSYATMCIDEMNMVCDELTKTKNGGENIMMVDIKGLDKAEVILALWNGSHEQGMSFLGTKTAHPTIADAREWIERNPSMYFDYLNGRVIKCDISGDEFDPRLYDRDCGACAAEAAIAEIRK